MVDFYGPTDLTQLYRETNASNIPFLNTFLGDTPTQYPARYADASPLTYVNSSVPPVLIIQGLADTTVVPSQSLELDTALTRADVPHTLITIPWATHGFSLTNLPGYNFVHDIVTFLHQALDQHTTMRNR